AQEPHFKVFEEFTAASYARRYEILLTKLVRERLYDATCFLMSNSTDGPKGHYSEPLIELGFRNFISSLLAKAIACKRTE
ncbi:MAG: PaeR7I family type II restriction endonuclease, partial [Terriglobales bacterium]